jgi:hypothetical protein
MLNVVETPERNLGGFLFELSTSPKAFIVLDLLSLQTRLQIPTSIDLFIVLDLLSLITKNETK